MTTIIMIMCRFTHPLAAIGTMSWPHLDLQRLRRSSWVGLPGLLWNHPMAETAKLEASSGRDCRNFNLRSRIELPTVTSRVELPYPETGDEEPRVCVWRA
jgi:hypothetical protein